MDIFCRYCRDAKNKIYTIYSEYTPNPDVMKFVSNHILSKTMIEFELTPNIKEYPLIYELFLFPFVKNVFLGMNFISIEKDPKINWDDVSFEIKDFRKLSIFLFTNFLIITTYIFLPKLSDQFICMV